ncbi:MAG: hypothetical protein HYR94_13675, partial [Chloroflexi bacterium]|nr:hypothetical protein [Chloroflexota bacterium]
RGETLRLAFGWQALAPLNANYMIRTSLLGRDGKRWAESETQPCHGDCPTVRWPAGMLAPPGSATIYWPVSAEVQPLPLEKVFDISHLKYRDGNEATVKIVPLPLTMTPFPGSLVDEHQVDLSRQLPPGEYTLLMTVYDPATGVSLPAYDEVAQVWLPAAEVLLGKIVAQ